MFLLYRLYIWTKNAEEDVDFNIRVLQAEQQQSEQSFWLDRSEYWPDRSEYWPELIRKLFSSLSKTVQKLVIYNTYTFTMFGGRWIILGEGNGLNLNGWLVKYVLFFLIFVLRTVLGFQF